MAKKKERFDSDGLIASFRKGTYQPVYFFCGEETFLIDEVVEALIRSAVDPSMREFNFDLVHGGETDGKKVVAMASAYPMMADRRVVIVKDVDRLSGKDLLEGYAEHPSSSTVLVLIAGSADFRKKPYSTFKKLEMVYEAVPLRDYETVAWLDHRLKTMKCSIEPAAVQLLSGLVGTSMRELVNAVEKVRLSAKEGATITVKDVERVVGVSKEFSPFELANKVAEKNPRKALEIADRLLHSGESPVGLIAVLTLHFIKLWKLQDALRQRLGEKEILPIVSFNSFALKEMQAQAGKFRPAEFENVFLLLADADRAAKSSGDPKLIMTRLISEIIAGEPVRQEAIHAA